MKSRTWNLEVYSGNQSKIFRMQLMALSFIKYVSKNETDKQIRKFSSAPE